MTRCPGLRRWHGGVPQRVSPDRFARTHTHTHTHTQTHTNTHTHTTHTHTHTHTPHIHTHTHEICEQEGLLCTPLLVHIMVRFTLALSKFARNVLYKYHIQTPITNRPCGRMVPVLACYSGGHQFEPRCKYIIIIIIYIFLLS